MPDERQYSVEQVLEVLQGLWPLGEDFEAALSEFAETRLNEWEDWGVVPGWWVSKKHRQRECLEVFAGLSDVFGFSATDEEWRPLANKKTTMRELAEFIAARAPYREIRPLKILGRECLEAGIFCELERTTRQIARGDACVGPSTPLRQALNKGQRERLASRLTLFFPRLSSSADLWRKSPLANAAWCCNGAVIVLTLACAGMVALSDSDSILAPSGCFVGMLALGLIPVLTLLGVASWVTGLGKGPFRKEIRTYRDLVNALKKQERRTADA